MKSPEDRRSPHVKRVSLAALVDICSQAGEGSPFQAESCNVSGRGMQVRTSFLPEIGEELVCRLNLDDEEVLVEGRVAWRAEGEDSGEFGVQFTALDADSAHLLQSLGEVQQEESPAASHGVDFEEDEAEAEHHLRSGSRVRLHIDGLGAPMKACVHEGNQRKLRVGSSLEFLKVGRNLQVEDLGGGESRGAQVDAVNVVINPATSVPELVVQLRYEGVTPTPAPAETQDRPDFDDEAFAQPARASVASDDTLDELDDDEAAPWEPAAEALRERLGGAVSSAGEAAQKATGLLGSLAQSARAQVAAVREKRAAKNESAEKPLRAQSKRVRNESRSSLPDGKRRVQSSRRQSRTAPSHLRSGIHDLGLASQAPRRQQRSSQKSESDVAVSQAPKRKLGAPVLFGAAFLVFAGSAVAFRGLGDSGEEVAAASAKAEENAVAAKTDTPPQKVAQAAAPAKAEPEASVVAEVPLFGPQAMAVKPAEPAPSRKDSAAAEKRAAAAAVADESWDEPAPVAETAEAKPWGRGRLYLPTIHRIRLDGAGTSLSGAVNQDGFTVVVPGRKAMESGKAIQKRDKRIMAVETNNNSGGATVKFEFRGSVPPYRVRLRKDFLEFLISAPEETVARL